MTPREAEIDRYVALYQRVGLAYRTTVRRLRLFRALIDERPDLRAGGLLDVGAGHGSMLATAKDAGYAPLAGTEAVPALCIPPVVLAPAWALPFPDRSFGTVTCVDVLEHLLPDDVPAALAEIARVARDRIVVEVSCRPSRWTDERGQLHMTIWTPVEWQRAAAGAWSARWLACERQGLEVETAASVLEGVPA